MTRYSSILTKILLRFIAFERTHHHVESTCYESFFGLQMLIVIFKYLAGEESLLLRLMHTSEGSDKIKSDLAKYVKNKKRSKVLPLLTCLIRKTKLEIQEFFNAFKVQFIGEKSLTITQRKIF